MKTAEGGQHIDRDARSRLLNDGAVEHMSSGDPVISVDAKEGTLGAYKNGGREWQHIGEPEPAKVHDFVRRLTVTVCHLPPGTSKWSRGRTALAGGPPQRSQRAGLSGIASCDRRDPLRRVTTRTRCLSPTARPVSRWRAAGGARRTPVAAACR